jgi:hypothetical protein
MPEDACTPDQVEVKRTFYRERYIKRCEDPAYRAKIAAKSLARYYARKARDAEAGTAAAKPQGRPRKYHDITSLYPVVLAV